MMKMLTSKTAKPHVVSIPSLIVRWFTIAAPPELSDVFASYRQDASRTGWLLAVRRGLTDTRMVTAVSSRMLADRRWTPSSSRVRRGAEPEAAGPGSAADREPAAVGDVLVPAARRHDRGLGDRPAGRARLPRRCRQGPGLGERGCRPGPRP